MRENITCPLELIFYILKGKWTPIILWRMRLGNQRLTDLKKDIVECNEKMLIQHLNDMIIYGLLEKIEFEVYPKHTEYRLTEFGLELIPVLAKFQELGIKYLIKK
ncbi:helix-turn-helix domain-containing protein [uncultured Cetobacterium sp.]|uniref:winged helix-turn-helix transcriptional regulator n=1 Tax=uncultured Cetobacterium sp. TaxID=527638 RepID=UPI002625505C|nr:helix-turn-helix domain-containing protein [uncultured Cetobacterium sp.]